MLEPLPDNSHHHCAGSTAPTPIECTSRPGESFHVLCFPVQFPRPWDFNKKLSVWKKKKMKNIPNPISIFRWETEAELRKALLPQATQSLSTRVREGTGSPNPHPQLLADGEESRPLELSLRDPQSYLPPPFLSWTWPGAACGQSHAASAPAQPPGQSPASAGPPASVATPWSGSRGRREGGYEGQGGHIQTKAVARQQHAWRWGCPERPVEKQGCGLEFPSPSQYLLLVLLLHGPEMLVPLLVHFQQLWGRDWGYQEISRGPKRANATTTSFAGTSCSVCGWWVHMLPWSCASHNFSSKWVSFINCHILPSPGKQD